MKKNYFITTKNAYELIFEEVTGDNFDRLYCLYSYDTIIAYYYYDCVTFTRYYDYSATTIQHLHKWLASHGIDNITIPEFRKKVEYSTQPHNALLKNGIFFCYDNGNYSMKKKFICRISTAAQLVY